MKEKFKLTLPLLVAFLTILISACGNNDRITLQTKSTSTEDPGTPGVSRELPSDLPIIDVGVDEPVIVDTTDPTTGGLAGDNDGDGYNWNEDCDDTNASINPGAAEVCDLLGIDENCDGQSSGTLYSGSITIDSSNESTLGTTASPLYGICGVSGDLIVYSTSLTSLEHFENIQTVAGSLGLVNNLNLTDVSGLSALESIGGNLGISFNAITDFDLPLIQSAANIYFMNNSDLQDVSGLNNIRTTGTIMFTANPNLTTISGFNQLTTAGHILILDEPSLSTFSGFSSLNDAEMLSFINLPLLTEMNGFNQLSSITNSLNFDSNSNLETLNGLTNLRTVSTLVEFKDNTQLPECAITEFLSRLTSSTHTLSITGSPAGVYYMDADSDNYGIGAPALCTATPPSSGYATVTGDCDDNDPNRNPGLSESILDGIDNNCDGIGDNLALDDITSSFTQLFSDSLSATTDSSGFPTHEAHEDYYKSLSAVGDYNGDGIPDLALSYPSYDGGRGEVCILPGPIALGTNINTTRSSSAKCFNYSSTSTIGFAGYSIANAGDFNGDGLDDLIVSIPHQRVYGKDKAGMVDIIFGQSTLSSMASSLSKVLRVSGTTLNDGQEGISVDSAGDVDQDGFDDVLIGFPGAGSMMSGETYLIYGSSLLSGVVTLTDIGAPASGSTVAGASFVGTANGDNLGYQVSSAGDFNDDGYADFMISAPHFDNNSESGAGKVYVVFGKAKTSSNPLLGNINLTPFNSTSSFVPSRGISVVGTRRYFELGTSLKALGDINGDGLDDIAIGSHGYYDSYVKFGAVYIYYGCASSCSSGHALGDDTDETTADVKIYGQDSHQNDFGRSVMSLGDLDGDGLSELSFGAPSADSDDGRPPLNEGQVYIVKGSALTGNTHAVEDIASSTLYGNNQNDFIGHMLGGGIDLTGDGKVNLLVSAPSADLSSGDTDVGLFYLLTLDY